MTGLDAVRWGSATAAYQIEGSVHSDGRCPSIWDTFTTRPGAVVHGDTGQVAADIYRNPRALLDAVEWLELETYRLSIPWCRIITGADGAANPAGILHYRRLLESLAARGVRPVVTLYHWDLPQWLQDRGGWTQLSTADAFDQFVAIAVREFGDLVEDWTTIN
ncbi:MAG TPA: family 1 glycosylhydrolase, partial [Propionicimonas sp.]